MPGNLDLGWSRLGPDLQGQNGKASYVSWWSAFSNLHIVSGPTLVGLLTPTYIKALPQNDGWSRPYGFGLDKAVGAANAAQQYGIRSQGKDGAFSTGAYTVGPTSLFDCDIVYSNGSFIVYPEGIQTQ